MAENFEFPVSIWRLGVPRTLALVLILFAATATISTSSSGAWASAPSEVFALVRSAAAVTAADDFYSYDARLGDASFSSASQSEGLFLGPKRKMAPSRIAFVATLSTPIIITTGSEFVATKTGGTGEAAKPRDPVTDLPRDAKGNIIGGSGPGKARELSDAEAQAVRDFEAGLSPDQKLLNSAKDKLKGQEK